MATHLTHSYESQKHAFVATHAHTHAHDLCCTIRFLLLQNLFAFFAPLKNIVDEEHLIRSLAEQVCHESNNASTPRSDGAVGTPRKRPVSHFTLALFVTCVFFFLVGWQSSIAIDNLSTLIQVSCLAATYGLTLYRVRLTRILLSLVCVLCALFPRITRSCPHRSRSGARRRQTKCSELWQLKSQACSRRRSRHSTARSA